jgi:hypothetical protein
MSKPITPPDIIQEDKVVNGVPGAPQRPPTPWQIFKSIFLWYDGMGPLERRTIMKQDITLLTFCCLSFFLKYLDQVRVHFSLIAYV